MNNVPKISVVMSVFDGASFVKEAIDSILNQTFSDFEFIIVDNASKDNTKEIISSYSDSRVILIENKENVGQTKALNIGIRRSRGEYIARMDADDVSLSQRFKLQYECLEKDKSIAVVGSWHEEINEKGKHLRYFTMPTNSLEIKCYLISPGELGYYCLSHPTVLVRRNVLFEAGLYDEQYCTQDYDLWSRIIRKHKIVNLNKFLVKHRISNRQQTREFRDKVAADAEKIIISNIRYYLPSLTEVDYLPLARMLLYKSQESKQDGPKALKTFDYFFDKYTDGIDDSSLANKIKVRITLFYLLKLFKTNPGYSSKEFLRIFCKNPSILTEPKFYRKIMKVLFAG